jgi:hypothetical protein
MVVAAGTQWEMTSRDPAAVRARRWQRGVADEWFTTARNPSSERFTRMEAFARAVRRLLEDPLSGTFPADIVSYLIPAFTSCDHMEFKDPAECMAYVCWHLVARYGRVHQALDALFGRGHLPVRCQGVKVLEVGAGPAPVVYATADYYQHLVHWCSATGQTMQVAPVTWAVTIDRGPAWGRTVHHLSEMLLLESDSTNSAEHRALPFSTTYQDLTGFSVRGLHHGGAQAAVRRLLNEADREDLGLDERRARELVVEEGGYPPVRTT